ncbi:MAG: HDOD domain-containing protein [Pseudomonadota bacterium]
MESPVVDERTPLEHANFRFVSDLASALNAREPIDIPSFPSVAMRIRNVLDDENCSPNTLTRVVGSEPALAARLLKMANSAAVNTTGREIVDLKTAINRLGHDQVRTAAMSFAMQSQMDGRQIEELKPHLSRLWNRSVKLAALSYSLAGRAEKVRADEAMFVGLVHDIGKLYVLTRVEAYPEIYASDEAVEHIMEEWHTAIGVSVLENWKIPESVRLAIDTRNHDSDVHTEQATLKDVVVAATVLANRAEQKNETCELDVGELESCARLGITNDTLPVIMQESQNEIAALENALKG